MLIRAWITPSPRPSQVDDNSEVDGQVPADEPRRVDRRRRVPRAAPRRIAGAVLICVLVGDCVIGVQQVAEVHAHIHAPLAESEDLREPHVDLRSPVVGVHAMVVVQDVDGRVAGRQTPGGRRPRLPWVITCSHLPRATRSSGGAIRTCRDEPSIFGTVRRHSPKRGLDRIGVATVAKFLYRAQVDECRAVFLFRPLSARPSSVHLEASATARPFVVPPATSGPGGTRVSVKRCRPRTDCAPGQVGFERDIVPCPRAPRGRPIDQRESGSHHRRQPESCGSRA